jgi:hypothetical protein
MKSSLDASKLILRRLPYCGVFSLKVSGAVFSISDLVRAVNCACRALVFAVIRSWLCGSNDGYLTYVHVEYLHVAATGVLQYTP